MRVRFAPSPTGFLHIGNARTALFNYLYAAHHNGTFVLRIEDTDKERSRKEYIDQIFSDLSWLGVKWQEGPDVGGAHGPYLQSERTPIYKEYVKKLLDEDKAYYCYCTQEELNILRESQKKVGLTPRYNGRCRHLTEEEMAEKHRQGILPCVRFKVEEKGTIVVEDLIRGNVRFEHAEIDDFVILRPDATPTFHFAVAIDDGCMEISHVIRGEDHLTNTPKHILIMRACGFRIPKYAHMPLTMGPGGAPLSKRFGAMSIHEYKKLGYLNEALANYMALLGWSPGDDRELFHIEDLQKEFSIERVSKSPSVFDIEKLNWIAGMHIRNLDDELFAKAAVAYALQENIIEGEDYKNRPEWFFKIMLVFKNYISCFSQLKEQLAIFLADVVAEDPSVLESTEGNAVISAAYEALNEFEFLDEANIGAYLKKIKKISGQKGKNLFMPLRCGVTGKLHGPDLQQIIILLGKRTCQQRLEKALEV